MVHTLSLLADRLAVCRLDAQAEIPAWASRRPFFAITRTSDELSIVCTAADVPAAVQQDAGWRAFKVEGPFAFTLTGVLVSVARPLAEAGIGILAIATYDTDYVLVKEGQVQAAILALRAQGHTIT
jgi:uncharacterized protein